MARLSNDDMKQLLQEFLLETREGVDSIESELIELEKDPSNRDYLQSIFRTMHTIKGSGGFLGLSKLEGVAHVAEDILTRALEGQLILTHASVTALLEAADALNSMTTSLEETGTEGDDDYEAVKNHLRAVTDATGRRTAKLTKKLATESLPLAGEGETWGLFDTDSDVVLADGSDEHKKTRDITLEKTAPAEATPKVEPQTPAKAPKALPVAKVESTVRIDVKLLDKLMNLVGELVLSRNQLLQYGDRMDDPSFHNVLHHTSLVTSELQENVMKARMQPIGTVFSKFPRIVRDLALNAGKQIELAVTGEDTELDRTILEGIRDPLVHLIRNSCDHGVEASHVREAAGKPAKGVIAIAAYHEGGQVNIDISDDGAGIDVERVRSKAIEKGVISAARATGLTDKDLRELIFASGFSTAEQVTNISGRGVGMDVVKTNIEKIGGIIEVDSEMGKGTTIRIKIPLTLAIIPALVVRAGGERFAVPQVILRELVRIDEGDSQRIEDVRGAEVFRLRGNLLPLVRLNQTLALEPGSAESQVENIVVVSTGHREIGIVVDEVNDVEEIVVKPLSRQIKHLKHFAGATIMGDGRVALILDTSGLASIVDATEEVKEAVGVRATTTSEPEEHQAEKQTLLLFSLGADDRFAIPLRLVSRLEKFARESIEYLDGRCVVQYRGTILPLMDAATQFTVEKQPEDADNPVNVVVFDVDGTHVGMLVNRIADITEASFTLSESSHRAGISGSAIIDGRATQLLDVFALLETCGYIQSNGNSVSPDSDVLSGNAGILVVDDSQFYRALIEGYLMDAGYSVCVHGSVAAAMEELEDQKFDLIISDLEMPDIDGFGFVRLVRADATIAGTPMVACTALSSPETVNAAKAAGFDEFLVKLDRNQLLTLASELTSGVRQEG